MATSRDHTDRGWMDETLIKSTREEVERTGLTLVTVQEHSYCLKKQPAISYM